MEVEIKKFQEKISELSQQLADVKLALSQADAKCTDLAAERLKYVNLSTQLTQENKKLYKRWFNMRKSVNKAALNEKLRKLSSKKQEEKKDQTKTKVKEVATKTRQLMEELKVTKTRNDELSKVKLELDAKIIGLIEESAKLKRDYAQLEQKMRHLRSQNETLIDEVKKKEAEQKEKEKLIEKQEEQTRDELKKGKLNIIVIFSICIK